MKNQDDRMQHLLSTSMILCVVVGLTGPVPLASAQTGATTSPAKSGVGAPASETPANTSTDVKNGFSEILRPTVRRKGPALAQPYAPIKKQDDQDQIPEIEMFVGESRVFPAPNVGRVAVGNGQIMTAAAIDKKEVLVFANAIGTSSLFIWNADGRYQRVKIHIMMGDTSRIAREVAGFLAAIPNAKASIVGDKVIVEGDNLPDADLAKIEMLEKRYPQLVNFTNHVGWEQMIMMDVKVVEFPKSELREIGLKWSSVGGATLGAVWAPVRRGNNGPYTVNIPSTDSGLPIDSATPGQPLIIPSPLNVLGALNLGLSAQLNLLEQEGKASVLAEPQLSARNGYKASFLAGGEFPYSVSNANGVTVLFKPYGIKLDITPKADRNGVIRATIVSEVSSIDASVSTPTGPALLTRRTDTEFNVRSGETMVLAGLLQRSSNTDIDKVPLLGDIPVLGALFRSKRFQNKETELVVFVTPTVVDSQTPGLVDRVNRTTERLEQRLGRQPYLTDPLQPGVPAADFNRSSSLPATDKRGAGQPSAETSGARIATETVSAVATPASERLPRTSSGDIPSEGGSVLQVVQEGAMLHAAPNPASPVLMRLGRGAVVQLGRGMNPAADSGSWRQVVVGKVVGWIASDAVVPFQVEKKLTPDIHADAAVLASQGQVLGTPVNGTPAPATLPLNDVDGKSARAARYRVLLNGLAVRATPDINAPIVLKLGSGRQVEVLPEKTVGFWTAIEVAGKRGWVATQWIAPE